MPTPLNSLLLSQGCKRPPLRHVITSEVRPLCYLNDTQMYFCMKLHKRTTVCENARLAACRRVLVSVRQANDTNRYFSGWVAESGRVLSPAVYYDSLIDPVPCRPLLHRSSCRLLCSVTAPASDTEITDCYRLVFHHGHREGTSRSKAEALQWVNCD